MNIESIKYIKYKPADNKEKQGNAELSLAWSETEISVELKAFSPWKGRVVCGGWEREISLAKDGSERISIENRSKRDGYIQL